MLPRGDNTFLGTILFSWCNDNSYDLSVFRQLLNNHTKHILGGQEKQNHFFSHGEIYPASSSLLGKNQKVSLKLAAPVAPHEFPHHISSARYRKYFVEYSVHYSTLSFCRDYHADLFPCTNLRESEA